MAFVQLEREQYHLVKPLFTGNEAVFMPCPLSILEGTTAGIVLVDDAERPTCAAVMSPDFIGGRLVGDPSNPAFCEGFITMARQRFFPNEDSGIAANNGANNGANGKPWLFWSTASETWDKLVFQLFGYRVFRIDRTQFRFDGEAFERAQATAVIEVDSQLKQPNGLHRIEEIDAELLAANEAVRKSVIGTWGSLENYLRHGIGWVSLSPDGHVRGRCSSPFIGGGQAELSIQVDKGVRGSGLGFHLCTKFIEDCMKRGLTPNWTCDTQNVASVKLAEKLGFRAYQPYYLFTAVYWPMFHEPART